MRSPIPIFFRQLAESPSARGIELTPPRGRQAHTAWLLGAITLTVDELDQRAPDWLLSLNVTAISEIDQIPQIAALCRVSALHQAPTWRALPDGVHARLDFAIDLQASFSHPLRPERAYVHVSARELCSPIVPVELELAPPEPSDEPSALIAAYTAAREHDWTRAVALFEALLEQPQLRTDVDACHLYNGACVLARAGLHERALAWLREDTQRRVHAHTRAVAAWLARGFGSADDPHGPHRHRLETAMREHFEIVENDPDLDSLGQHRTIAALLDQP